MSAGLEHQECLESLAVYALGALPDEEADRVREHLVTCHECRAELTWLRGAVDALPASVEPIEPPRELRDRLMEIVESEAALLRAAGEAADRPPQRAPSRRHWLPRFAGSRAAALALASAAVALVLVLALSGGSGTRVIRAQILQPSSGPIFATLRLDGTRAQLQVGGLPLPPAGHVDELWVKPRSGANPQPAGTFVLKSGSVDVLRPVRSGDLVLVTVEPGRGTAAPTTTPVIRARA